MSYTIHDGKIKARAAASLSPEPEREQITNRVIGPAPYDLIAPGLYPDETVVRLDTGELIAVSVERRRLANGAGMDFRAWARHINDDGSTKLDQHGQEIETAAQWTADQTALLHGADVLARELLLAVLGEESDARAPVMVDDGAAPHDISKLDHKFYSDPKAHERAIIPWGQAFRLSVSIRTALAAAGHATSPDAGALLKGE